MAYALRHPMPPASVVATTLFVQVEAPRAQRTRRRTEGSMLLLRRMPGASLRRALLAAQHRGDEILAMRVAREPDAEHVQDHERQSDVRERAVHFGDAGLPALSAFRFSGAAFVFPAMGDRRNHCAVGRERPFAALAIGD